LGTGLGSVSLARHEGVLQLAADLPGDRLGIVVYESGFRVGWTTLADSMRTLIISGNPGVTGVGAHATTADSPAEYTIQFDKNIIFTTANGLCLVGDAIHVQALQTVTGEDGTTLLATNGLPVGSVQTFLLTAANVPAVVITGETQEPAGVPPIRIRGAGTNLVVSWADPNQMFCLEAASVMSGPFAAVSGTYSWSAVTEVASLTFPHYESPRMFFRLRGQQYFGYAD
jgi:hypothetical protein